MYTSDELIIIVFQSPYQLGGTWCDSRQHISTYNSIATFLFSQHLSENLKEVGNLKPFTDIILIVSASFKHKLNIEFCRWNHNSTWSIVCFISASCKTRALLVKLQPSILQNCKSHSSCLC